MPRTAPKREWLAEPPPSGRGQYDWAGIVAELRTHPGEWTLALPDSPTSLVVAIKNRSMTALQTTDGTVEVRRRNSYDNPTTGRRHADLYMRFVPAGEDGET